MWYTFCAKPMILIDRIVTLRSRSPCGERGLKFSPSSWITRSRGRSPCGERGLKSTCRFLHPEIQPSLPVRGAWIEMTVSRRMMIDSWSLPVRGAWIEMAGMRSMTQAQVVSLPVRGAWIEIARLQSQARAKWSLPVRGAWIEIRRLKLYPCKLARRSPCGERGLKFRADGDAPR